MNGTVTAVFPVLQLLNVEQEDLQTKMRVSKCSNIGNRLPAPRPHAIGGLEFRWSTSLVVHTPLTLVKVITKGLWQPTPTINMVYGRSVALVNYRSMGVYCIQWFYSLSKQTISISLIFFIALLLRREL